VEIIAASLDDAAQLGRVDDEADLILLSREAVAVGLEQRFSRAERIRDWVYEFDPSGLELLRRSIEQVQATRRVA
jgi:hypothetical protein